MASRTIRFANGAMLVLFLSWMGFQHNDADALVWVAVYGVAAVECLLFFMGRLPAFLALAYIVLCLLWAPFLGVSMVMAGEFVFGELGREMIGLLICAGWTYVLYRSPRRRTALEASRM